MRRKFLVLYDYGQGGVWAYLLADTKEQINDSYPQLQIYDEPPASLTPEALARISARMTIDISDRDNEFLQELRRQ